MIFVLRTPEGDVYEVVGHRLDDVEDRPTTPTPSKANFASDVEDGQRRAVDMNVAGDDHLCCICYTRTPGWIKVLAHIYRRADNNYVMAYIQRGLI